MKMRNVTILACACMVATSLSAFAATTKTPTKTTPAKTTKAVETTAKNVMIENQDLNIVKIVMDDGTEKTIDLSKMTKNSDGSLSYSVDDGTQIVLEGVTEAAADLQVAETKEGALSSKAKTAKDLTKTAEATAKNVMVNNESADVITIVMNDGTEKTIEISKMTKNSDGTLSYTTDDGTQIVLEGVVEAGIEITAVEDKDAADKMIKIKNPAMANKKNQKDKTTQQTSVIRVKNATATTPATSIAAQETGKSVSAQEAK